MKLKNSDSIYSPISNYLELLNPIIPTDDELRDLVDNLKAEDFFPILYSDL